MKYLYRTLSIIHTIAAGTVRAVASTVYRAQAWVPISLRLSIGFVILAAISAGFWWGAPQFLGWSLSNMKNFGDIEFAEVLAKSGAPESFERIAACSFGVGIACLVTALLAWIKQGWALHAMRAVASAFILLWVWIFAIVTALPSTLHDFDYERYTSDLRNEDWTNLGIPLVALVVFPLVLIAAVWLSSTRRAYTGRPPAVRNWADRLQNLFRRDTGDRRLRGSAVWSIFIFLALILIPYLLSLFQFGGQDPYGLIKGKGEAAVNVVIKMKKPKKKPKKKMIVNKWSPYIFEQMKLEDITIIDEIEDDTADQYAAQVGKTGNMGTGGKGPGGWPQGLVDGRIRFIRLEYGGGDWDQDMGKGADYNLLIRFHEITGFPIEDDTEHIPISELRRFPKDRAPPFVFLTGKGSINVSSSEIKTLRWYCIEEGGCLFIDNGGGVFHTSVVRLMQRVFPEKSLKEIALDDPIFDAPFKFPNGAPPFWHHAGNRAKGIRHGGRWAVFYHPGDVNDAWKTGHSGAGKAVAEQAYQLGINVMYYTFNQYYRIHFEE